MVGSREQRSDAHVELRPHSARSVQVGAGIVEMNYLLRVSRVLPSLPG